MRININKNRNTKTPLSKKPLHIEYNEPICIANQSTGSYMRPQ